MKKTKYVYEDPTGGGDDAELILPNLFRPPVEIKVDDGKDIFIMSLVDDLGEDVEE